MSGVSGTVVNPSSRRPAPPQTPRGVAAASLPSAAHAFSSGAALLVSIVLASPLLAGAAPKRQPATKAPEARFSRGVARVDVPAVPVVDQDGRSASLSDLLDRREPVVVNFFFASCGSICPVMTASIAAMRETLGRDGQVLKTVSITIDPDQDSPDVLKAYARRFSAGPGWTFLTAEPEVIASIQKAFGAETGGKFNHKALYYFRAANSDSWVRIEGLAAARDLVAEARGVLRETVTRR